MPNCEIYADVDFGRGPVEVRCTMTGQHTQHRCSVDIYIDVDEPVIEHKKESVFDKLIKDGIGPETNFKKGW